MSFSFLIHELSVVLLVHNQHPNLLNLDFLKYSGIVPQDWELANEAVATPNISQLIFDNGLRIVADTNRTIFTQKIADKSLNDIVVADVAKLYTQVLPHAEYKALGINPEGFTTFPEHPEIAQDYLSQILLSSAPWLEFGNTPPRVDLNISYTLDAGTLNLKVYQGFFRQEQGGNSIPIVAYSGNFEYIFQQLAPSEKLAALCKTLEEWQLNVETFKNLIQNKFLKSFSTPFLVRDTDPLMGEPIEIALK